MFDILDISDPQAQVLRAIAIHEYKTKKKGVTQYNCKEIPEISVSDGTFNDQIKKLSPKQMVWKLTERKKSKPYTITDLGQIAWLRYFPIEKNLEIISDIFPNIINKDLLKIINSIENPIKEISNEQIVQWVLKETFSQFHVNDQKDLPYVKFVLEEKISIFSKSKHVETSYIRYYNIIHPKIDISKVIKATNAVKDFSENYENIMIKIPDRIEFLFYYILIQIISDVPYSLAIIMKYMPTKKDLKELTILVEKQSQLAKNITRKKKDILKMITSNNEIQGNIKNNLTQLEEYYNTEFDQFYKLFFK